MPKRSYVQKRLSIYNWNPGPRRGKEGALERQIAGKWHVVTLQEVIDDVDHELRTKRFHVTHNGGCAVLFNKDTFYPDIEVKSSSLHDTRRELPDKVMEGGQGWVMQGVLSRAHFVDLLSAARKHSQFCPYILPISTPKTWYWEKAHPHDSSRDAWRTCGPGCGRFQWGRVAMQQ